METPNEQEMSRAYYPNLIDIKQDITREYTISDLLHKIDPSASIEPLAESLLLDIADDFIDTVVKLSSEYMKMRDPKTLTADDVRYCIDRKFGDTTPGSTKYGFKTQRGFMPTEAHLKRLSAIENSIQSNQ